MKYSDQGMQQQIEAYLRQEMTDLERSGFERRMHDDEELHEEVRRQEAIIGAIRQERMLVLKSGLQQVNISLWSVRLLESLKIAALAGGLGLVSAGAYYFLREPEQAEKLAGGSKGSRNELVIPPSTEENSPLASTQVSDSHLPQQKEVSGQIRPLPTQALPLSDNSRTHNSQNTLAVVPENGSASSAEAAEPVPHQIQPETARDISLPEDGLSGGTRPESMQPEIVVKRDNREKFHYQFSDGKLVLYADFNEKLYEVLELNQHGQRQLYLAYDGKYFSLDPAVSEISPLKELKDKNLIQILTVLQKKR